jgi:uncharacterized membrane protein YraQ (UPF0718 family)
MAIIRELAIAVWGYLAADWPLLLFGILLAAGLQVYVDAERLRRFMARRSGIGIVGSITAGSLTPLCACGTMAVILSMLVSAVSWGPVMAFLVSSPLTSPSEFVFETVFLGKSFALAMLLSSILLGVGAGILSSQLEKRTRFFEGQLRSTPSRRCGCDCRPAEAGMAGSAGEKSGPGPLLERLKFRQFLQAFFRLGFLRILPWFILFIAIGRFVEIIVPREWMTASFGAAHAWSVPVAALLGLPLYLTDSGALPLLRSAVEAGAAPGAVLAFLITGKATGIPVIAGMSVILKARALGYYVGLVTVGGVLAGYAYQFMAG